MNQLICRWKPVPIQKNSRDLNSLDFDEKRISGETVAYSVVKDGDDREDDRK